MTVAGPSALQRFTERLVEVIHRQPTPAGGRCVAVTVSELGGRDELARRPAHPPARPPDFTVPVQLAGEHAIVGPVPAPDGTVAACGTCAARRWQAVRHDTVRNAVESGGSTRRCGESPYLTTFAADTLASVVVGAVGAPAARRSGPFPMLHTVHLGDLTVRSYPVVPDPECPQCGRVAADSPEAACITLVPAPKSSAGSFRQQGIESYRLPVSAFANPICGALGTSVGSDLTSPSTAATYGTFSTRSGHYLRGTFWGGHAETYRTSSLIGVLEGLERYAGLRPRGKRRTVVASYNSVREQALDPRRCGLYSDAFYRSHPAITPFDPDRPIPWAWAYSMEQAAPVLVPEILAYYHSSGLPDRFVQESSNGAATGGSMAEAVYFGLMEAIERDAFLLMWYSRFAAPEIDPGTSTVGRTRHMIDRLALYGYRSRFFDLRVTFPIPVVGAVAERVDGGLGRMCVGAGASLDPEAAMSAALCEIATDAVNLTSRTERDEARLRSMAADFDLVEGLHDHPLLFGIPEMGRHADFLLAGRGLPPASLADVYQRSRPSPPIGDDLKDDVDRSMALVRAAGFDIVIVDQTMPEQRDLGLCTVKVLVPGLIPIDFGWQRQRVLQSPRLLTALHQAALRDDDLRPDDINHVPHPFP